MDSAPIDIAGAFLDIARADFPWTQLLFIARGSTLFDQPLDISMIKRFKGHIQHQCAWACARDIVQATSPVGLLAKTPQLRVPLCGLVSAGWKHLWVGEVGDEAWLSALQRAQDLRASGHLFGPGDENKVGEETQDDVCQILGRRGFRDS